MSEWQPIIVALVWTFCALVSSGFANAYWQAEFPRLNSRRDRLGDLTFSLAFCSFLGPASIPMTFFLTNYWRDGWTLRLNDGETAP
jgi:hypothetical protein